MLIATDSCEVYEVLDSDGTSLHKGPLLQGHFGNGVRGLGTHPTNSDLFATAGADRTIRVWSKSARRMVRGMHVPQSSEVAAFVVTKQAL